MIANRGFLVFNDPYGIRPLVMGQRKDRDGITYGFTSESTCFDYLGYDTVSDLQPGETVFIDAQHRVHRTTCLEGKAFCVFEYIYFCP